jgi:hypothetical protein
MNGQRLQPSHLPVQVFMGLVFNCGLIPTEAPSFFRCAVEGSWQKLRTRPLRCFGDATGRRARYDFRRWLVANDPSRLTTNTTKTATARMTTITGYPSNAPSTGNSRANLQRRVFNKLQRITPLSVEANQHKCRPFPSVFLSARSSNRPVSRPQKAKNPGNCQGSASWFCLLAGYG